MVKGANGSMLDRPFKACFTVVMESSRIIDLLGGTKRVADLCEISSQAVSQWREKGIPKPWLKFLRLAHPEIFTAHVEPAAESREAA